jgi:hypothetical protein
VTSVIYLRDVGEFDVTIGMGVMFFMIGIAEMFMYSISTPTSIRLTCSGVFVHKEKYSVFLVLKN